MVHSNFQFLVVTIYTLKVTNHLVKHFKTKCGHLNIIETKFRSVDRHKKKKEVPEAD